MIKNQIENCINLIRKAKPNNFADGPEWRPTSVVGCGTQAPNYKPTLTKTTRIIGGSEAKPHSWPWLVALDLSSISFQTCSTNFQCGSSLIRIRDGVEESDILLTAAHCVTIPVNGTW